MGSRHLLQFVTVYATPAGLCTQVSTPNRSVFEKFDTAGALRVRSEFDNQIVARDYHLIVRMLWNAVLPHCYAPLPPL